MPRVPSGLNESEGTTSFGACEVNGQVFPRCYIASEFTLKADGNEIEIVVTKEAYKSCGCPIGDSILSLFRSPDSVTTDELRIFGIDNVPHYLSYHRSGDFSYSEFGRAGLGKLSIFRGLLVAMNKAGESDSTIEEATSFVESCMNDVNSAFWNAVANTFWNAVAES